MSLDAYIEARDLLTEHDQDAEPRASQPKPQARRGRDRHVDRQAGAPEPRPQPARAPLDDEFFLISEVAERLKLSENRVREYCKAGHRVSNGYPISGPYIVAYKFGSTWRITKLEVLAFLARASTTRRAP